MTCGPGASRIQWKYLGSTTAGKLSPVRYDFTKELCDCTLDAQAWPGPVGPRAGKSRCYKGKGDKEGNMYIVT